MESVPADGRCLPSQQPKPFEGRHDLLSDTGPMVAPLGSSVSTLESRMSLDFTDRFIYYVGPVDPVRDEVVGPAGPTTATRMDPFTEMMLARTGLIAMIGRADRGPEAIAAIEKHKSAYLMAVGGAAYLLSKAIKHSRIV